MKIVTLTLFLFAGATSAQVSAYGQCGGIGYSGATSCVSGYLCTYQNDYYSQCVPGTVTVATSSKTGTTTIRPTTLSTTRTSSSTVPTSTGSISKVTGLNFTIDGVTKYFAGTNCYWIAFLTNNADVDLVLDHLKSSGIKILRIWGFNDVNSLPGTGTVYFQYHSNGASTINTGTYGLQRLDYVVSSAEARGIKLIINFVNNWDDYGGMNAYVKAYGGSKTSWYTTSSIQTAYKAYIKAVVSRYTNSNAVFAWELANEPRCNGCDTSVIYNWIKTTSAYIKSLDSRHMVIIGDEGFGLSTGSDGSYPYQTSEGLNFTQNLGIDSIDFGTLHLYPSSWGTTNDWGNAWISNHAAACKAAGKPCMLEEYGVTSDHCSIESVWQNTALQKSPGMAADLFWQLGDTISTGKSSDDGNTIYYGSSDWTCLVTNHVKAIG